MFVSLLSFIGLHREKNTSCAVSVFLDLKGKATFEAHFHVFLTASYTYLWYPLVMIYNYLNQSFFLLSYSFYAQNDLWYYIPPKTPCLKLAVLAYFLLSSPSYTTVPPHSFSKGASVLHHYVSEGSVSAIDRKCHV